ncbi:MAG: FmdE family protein [Desulfatiglandales bacterium]
MKIDFQKKTDTLFLGPGLGSISAERLEGLVSFHGYLATGAFIGMQMSALGRRLLGLENGERIHVVCETINCLPDPFQYLDGCTVGNKGLIIEDTGKMAVTITKHAPPNEDAPGVRIVLDANKTKHYPKLHAWYMKTGKVPHDETIETLIEAGENVYSYERVSVPVPGRIEKIITICSDCGESFVRNKTNCDYCPDCRKEKL